MPEAIDQEIASLYDEAGIPGPAHPFREAPYPAVPTRVDDDSARDLRRGDPLGDESDGRRDARTRVCRKCREQRRSDPPHPAERSAAGCAPLFAEWRATEATVRELEAEIPYALSQVIKHIDAALATRSFRERLNDNLAKGVEGRRR